MTEKNFRQFIKLYSIFKEDLDKNLVDIREKLYSDFKYGYHIDDIEFNSTEDNFILASVKGDLDSINIAYVRLPFDIVLENEKNKYIEEEIKKREMEKENKIQLEKEKAQEREEKEKKLFEKLKLKYEGETDLTKKIEKLEEEKLMLAKLSSKKPMFFNPLECIKAKKIRDRILGTCDKE